MFGKNIVFSFLLHILYTVILVVVIGIIGRPMVINGNEGIVAYKGLCDKLFSYGVFPICLIPSINGDFSFDENNLSRLKQMIGFCDGIVLQGGEEFNDMDLEITKYLYDLNIPVLGICLGMQIMGKAFNGKILTDAGHDISKDYVHYVKIDTNSKLYEIIGKEYIFVNSKHHDRVYYTDLDISCYCCDVVEALEDKEKDFFLGVQWHPESLDDINSDKLFKAFILACKNYRNNI